MKTIKYIFALLATPLAFVACSNDPVQPQTETTTSEGKAITFTSTISDQLERLAEENLDGDANTRASFDATNQMVTWSTSDNISISDGTLMYTYQPQTGGTTTAEFQPKTGKSSFSTSQEGTFYAFYPAAAVKGWNGPTVTTMIYTEQDYLENLDDSGVMGPYMVATATTTNGGSNASFTFGHICSVIDVDLSTFDGGEVESVALYANSQISIAGSMQFNVSTKAATISGNDGAGYSNSLQSEVVRVSEINAMQPTVRFYILPMKQTAGFTITIRCSDGKYYTKSSSNSVGSNETNDYITTQSGVTGGTLCKPYYKKYNFGTKSSARTQNWMAMIPGNVKFNHLSLPGAHDAATSACSNSSAKCQQYTIAELLAKGCRALDLRPLYNSSDLEIGHGTTSYGKTGVKLSAALTTIQSFLSSNPTETVFVLLAQEGGSDGNTNWQNRVWSCIDNYTSYIASYGWEGNLNPCRGKMVVIFRNTYTGGDNNGDLGCGKVGWGSSFNDKSIMTGNGSGTARGTLRYQDEYETSNTSTKLGNLTTMLNDHIAANETNAGYTFVNNVNIAGTLSNISSLSTSMNTTFLNSSTFTNHTGKFCIMMTDFLFSSDQKGDQMFELIHKQNYKYVYKNRSRCSTASASGTDTGVDISSDEYADDSQVYVRREL